MRGEETNPKTLAAATRKKTTRLFNALERVTHASMYIYYNNLNRDQKSQSDSSSSSVFGSNVNTANFPVDNPGNDADSSDNFVATQNEEVATLEEKIFSKGILDQNQNSSHDVQNTNAMNQEMAALLRVGTWDIVDLPKGRKAIESKWIYKIKFRSSDEIDRYKARLIAQGFGQKKGIDYEETFSPVVKMVTVRCLLNTVVSIKRYRALASVTSEVIWILKILKDLNIENLSPVSLHCDSNSAIKIAANPVFHERTKHLEIDLRFVIEIFLKGVVKTVKVESANQIADILTKGLDTIQHIELVKKLGMHDVYQVETKGRMLK
ncbi:ribonuclease H-like domain-containing protein [Tanacetum coccineum]